MSTPQAALRHIDELEPLGEWEVEDRHITALREGRSLVAERRRFRGVFDVKSGSVRLESPQEQPERATARLEGVFRALADEWITDTQYDSSPTDKYLHPAHLQIIGMSSPIVPLILREVERMSGHWFLALRSITRQDPVTPEEAASVEGTAQAWLRWGRERGLI